jgi:hypothetical protein
MARVPAGSIRGRSSRRSCRSEPFVEPWEVRKARHGEFGGVQVDWRRAWDVHLAPPDETRGCAAYREGREFGELRAQLGDKDR